MGREQKEPMRFEIQAARCRAEFIAAGFPTDANGTAKEVQKSMQAQRGEMQLFELLGRTIKDLERIEDDPKTLNFVARRLGNIVKHMKDLRDDLQPRGGANGSAYAPSADERFHPRM